MGREKVASGRFGKAGWRIMDVVYQHLGAASRSVVLGPGRGLDNAFIAIGKKNVMVVSTDPVSLIPGIGIETSAWLSVHLIASDVATSGVLPKYATFSLNLPDTMSSSQKGRFVSGLGDACADLNITVISGHTGTYPGAGFTVVGGGVMLALARRGRYVDPSMARVGDDILMTKGAAIEATASLAWAFPQFVRERVGDDFAKRGKGLLKKCTVVKDAAIASTIGLGVQGVTSMHDATEGGVLGGLQEMSDASSKRYMVDTDQIIVPKEVNAICKTFGINPLTSLSEGTLLLTCRPGATQKVRRKLRSAGINTAVLGSVTEGTGLWVRKDDVRPRRFTHVTDGYWSAYDAAIKKELGRVRN